LRRYVKGFEQDVGGKTTFDVINLQHTKPFVAGRVRTGGTQPEALRGRGLRSSTYHRLNISRFWH